MDELLRHDVARYIYSFFGNGCYHNELYYNNLIKKYGRKAVLDAMQWESVNGNISDAFTYKK